MKLKNVLTRSASGIVYVALIVGAVLAGGYWFLALATLFTVIGLCEYQNLVAHHVGAPLPWYVRALDMCAALSLLCTVICCYVNTAPDSAADYVMPLVTALMMGGILLVYSLLRFVFALAQKEGDAFATVAYSVLGILYIPVPLTLLSLYIMAHPGGWFAPLAMFVLIWLNDTGAFCFGSTLGRHKMCERLSPKKSWEGFWGGLLVCVVAGVIAALVRDGNMTLYVVYAIVVSIFSTWGDLFESLMKRSAHVKDAGNLIPGHGGVLDRIDSLLFVIPASAIVLAVVELL